MGHRKNAGLDPKNISHGSRKHVWWCCEKGHNWQAIVYTRTGGASCPFCTGKRPWPGENDLASQYPAIAAQWHPTRNNGLTPADVTCGSHRKVWWRCGHGHEWQAIVKSRISGTGCPVCANRILLPGVNDLTTVYPALAAQWHPQKNGTLRPAQVMAGNRRKVWWICKNGHEWQAAISARTNSGSGCLYCAGRKVLAGFNDLASREPGIAGQWHPTLNGTLTPEMVTMGSHKKVWWQCPDGHVWRTAIYSRTGVKKCGCPVCAGKVRKRRHGTSADASLTSF